MEIAQIEIDTLVPYAANARTHSEAQVAQIAASIKEFGFNNPILLADDNTILAGHGRVLASRKLKRKSVPCVYLSHLSETQRKAYMIADNQLALNAGWDMDLLAVEMKGLDESGFDLSLIGFNDVELGDILGGEDAVPKGVESIPADRLNEAWREWAKEAAEQYSILSESGYTFSGITEAYAKIHFLKAKYMGSEYPRHCSIAFHTHQFMTNGEQLSAFDGLLAVADGGIKAERLRFVFDEKPSAYRLYAGTMPFAAARLPLDFPANLARDLINEHAVGGRVLDPCHGWGGRAVGFMLSDAVEYVGVDASPDQGRGVERILECLMPLADSGKQANLLVDKFEDAEVGEGYDFAITSPPYFDVEKYQGGDQSYVEFGSYDLWRDEFYRNLIFKVYGALKDGGVFALQVGSQRYPLLTDGKDISKEAGFRVKAVHQTDMINRFHETEEDSAEAILLLIK